MSAPKKEKRSAVYKEVKSLSKFLKKDATPYQKQWRSSTTQHWMDIRKSLKAQKKHYRGYKRHQKNTKVHDSLRLSKYDTVFETMRKGTLQVESRVHTIPPQQQFSIFPKTVKKIKSQIEFVVKKHLPKPIKKRDNVRRRINAEIRKRRPAEELLYRINVEGKGGQQISTPVMKSPQAALHYIMKTWIEPKSRAYNDKEFLITKITFATVKSSIMQGYTRSIKVAHDKWHICDNNARGNCVFQSVALCRNYKTNPTLLQGGQPLSISGVKLKANVAKLGLSNKKNGGDETTVQEICNFVKAPIKLYNNLFEETRHFEPESYNYKKGSKNVKYFFNNVRLYEIQKVGNHCVALIDKKEMQIALPDFEFKKLEAPKILASNTDRLIKKSHLKHMPHSFNEKIAAWDIETSKDKDQIHVPYACAIAWMEDGVQFERQFWGLDCLVQFLSFLYTGKFNGYTLYAHNGGKYDINLLMKYALLGQSDWVINGSKCIELNNAWIGFEIQDAVCPKNHFIKFKDSYRILPMGLEKLCKELNVKHKKLTETITHDDITLLNYGGFPALKKYLSHDVRGLLEAMLIFNKSVFDDLKIDVTTCFTGASLSKATFFRNYYDQYKIPVFSLSDDHDKFIRDGYFGGRVECFKIGGILNAYYYDFTSLYPDVGRQHLPYGKPVEVDFNGATKIDASFFGFVKCLVKTKPGKISKNGNARGALAIPKHAVIRDSRLTFPIFTQWAPISCFSAEIDYKIYDYKFETGLAFQKATFMSKFFSDGFEKKAQAKADGCPAMAQCHKIIINSGYGFWGLRTKNRDGVIICDTDSHDYMQYLNTERLVNMREHEDGTMFCRVLKDLEVTDFNVGVASAIASYARLKLHSLLTAIKKVGGTIKYCDTDSVICDINLNDYPEIKETFQWDGNGAELGSLKNECDEVVEKKLKQLYPNDKPKQKKTFNKMVSAEHGNLSFDKGLIEGCKMYGLKKEIVVEGKSYGLEVLKCKGYSQSDRALSYEDFENIDRGGVLTQKQNQFRCPKSNYVSETEAFTIKTIGVSKSFKKVYNKGVVGAGGIVTPHEL